MNMGQRRLARSDCSCIVADWRTAFDRTPDRRLSTMCMEPPAHADHIRSTDSVSMANCARDKRTLMSYLSLVGCTNCGEAVIMVGSAEQWCHTLASGSALDDMLVLLPLGTLVGCRMRRSSGIPLDRTNGSSFQNADAAVDKRYSVDVDVPFSAAQ